MNQGGMGEYDQVMLEHLLEMGALTPEQQAIERQRKMAEQLRAGGAMPEMRQAGRVSVAAHPLEALNAGLSGALGAYQGGLADRRAGALDKARTDAFGRFAGRARGIIDRPTSWVSQEQ